MPEYSKELVAASSIPLVLAILARGESYGYEIIKTIRESSDGELEFAEGTLYPILKKLEEKKMISSHWKNAGGERQRKYYKLTSDGKKQLAKEKNNWSFVNSILERLWQTQSFSFKHL